MTLYKNSYFLSGKGVLGQQRFKCHDLLDIHGLSIKFHT